MPKFVGIALLCIFLLPAGAQEEQEDEGEGLTVDQLIELYGPYPEMEDIPEGTMLTDEAVQYLEMAPEREERERQMELERERFELFSQCQPLRLVVESVRENTAGLTTERLQQAAEGRLREAGLFSDSRLPPSSPILYINANVVREAYSVDVAFRKWLHDPASDRFSSATTWDSGSAGTHAGNSEFILSSMLRQLEEFIAAYQRVNEEACE